MEMSNDVEKQLEYYAFPQVLNKPLLSWQVNMADRCCVKFLFNRKTSLELESSPGTGYQF